MPMNKETEAEVLRLFHAEGWRRNTIAKQLGLHHSAVQRVLARNGLLPKVLRPRTSKVDAYLPFITRTLTKYPKLNATRLYQMVRERGYTGGVDHFRDIVARLRPRSKGEAYLRLATLPGEQAQCDWAHFGKLKVGNAERRLLAFVMVLSWSRRLFLRFYFGDSTANFLRGHVDAFEHFQAVAREVLYDNLKSAVLERLGDAIHFNPDLLSLAAHYRFAPKPVPVARANEKGRVERAIRYCRTSFFAARKFRDINDLNEQAVAWCVQEAKERLCPQDKSMTVAEVFAQERKALLELPQSPFPVYDRKQVHIGKTPYARFDLNDYSLPHGYVNRALLVEATLDTVSITDGPTVVARHARSFDKGQQIEDRAHIDNLVVAKREAHKHRAIDRLRYVAPSSEQFFLRAAERGSNLGRLTQLLIRLLDLYGAAELEAALSECLMRGNVHSAAVQSALERRRATQGLPPPVPLQFSQRRLEKFQLVPKSLDKYNKLLETEETT
jgi:transposase